MSINKNRVYTTQQVAEMFRFTTKKSFLEFLRKYHILKGITPAPQYLEMGYFLLETCVVHGIKGRLMSYPLLRITEKGVKFIDGLHTLLFHDIYA